MKQKAGIIIPVRDRENHLKELLLSLRQSLDNQRLQYEIIVVEQEHGKPFNRGKLLNIGAQIAKKLNCTYLILHDVDKTPVDVDYSYTEKPTLLCTLEEISEGSLQETPKDYFSGVVSISLEHFEKINGYSNEYWGWGFEDNDLLYRVKSKNLPVHTIREQVRRKSTTGLLFNGSDSYVKVPMDFGLKNYTFLISFQVFDFICNPLKSIDVFPIFGIKEIGKQTDSITYLTYDSYKDLKFTTLSGTQKITTRIPNISPSQQILCITANQYDRELKFYRDGDLQSNVSFSKPLDKHLKDTEYIFLGNSGKKIDKGYQFRGIIDYFAIFNHSLEPEQIKSISKEVNLGLLENYDGYLSQHSLEVLYDMKISTNKKVYDLSGNNRHGEIFHCDRIPTRLTEAQVSYIPFRKKNVFKNLSHKDSGYNSRTGKWKSLEARKNQIRFYNKVLTGEVDIDKDGISTVEYKEISSSNKKKVTTIKVSI